MGLNAISGYCGVPHPISAANVSVPFCAKNENAKSSEVTPSDESESNKTKVILGTLTALGLVAAGICLLKNGRVQNYLKKNEAITDRLIKMSNKGKYISPSDTKVVNGCLVNKETGKPITGCVLQPFGKIGSIDLTRYKDGKLVKQYGFDYDVATGQMKCVAKNIAKPD